MIDFFDRLIARAQSDTLLVEPALPSWFAVRAADAAIDREPFGPVDSVSHTADPFVPEDKALAPPTAVYAPAMPQESDTRAREPAEASALMDPPAEPAVRSPPQPVRADAPAQAAVPVFEPIVRETTVAPYAADVPAVARLEGPGEARSPIVPHTRVAALWDEPRRAPDRSRSSEGRVPQERGSHPFAAARGMVEPVDHANTTRARRTASLSVAEHEPTRARVGTLRDDDDRATTTRSEVGGPTIQITIGRVELRAAPSVARPVTPAAPQQAQPALSLDEYLRQRAAGGGQ